METSSRQPVRRVIWRNLLFFIFTGVLGFIVAPVVAWKNGVNSWVLWTALFYAGATGMAITVGYHRLFSHRAFSAHPFIEFLALFFGAAAFEQSVLDWASQHRDHHRFVDTEKDPYNIHKGFFYAHIGWLIFWQHHIDHANVQDLKGMRWVRHQDKNYLLWAVLSGILLPVAIGFAVGHAWEMFLFAVCARLAWVHHATFCINSVCHSMGRPSYDDRCTAKDHWFVAFLTNGEGYHSFHHRFPSDYRNGVRWYQWDPSKWAIWSLSRLGLTQELRRTSRFQILHARLTVDYRLAGRYATLAPIPAQAEIVRVVRLRYDRLIGRLKDWEAAVSLRRQERIGEPAKKISAEIRAARRRFERAYHLWRVHPYIRRSAEVFPA